MRRLSAGLALAALVLVVSCSAPERVVRQAASLEEAQRMVAETGGLIVLEFWADG